MSTTKPDVSDRWIQAVRRNAKTAQSWTCRLCPERRIFTSSQSLWVHAKIDHHQRLPSGEEELIKFRPEFEAESSSKTSNLATKGNSQSKPILNGANRAHPEPPPLKRPLCSPIRLSPTRSISGLGALNLGTTGDSTDVDMSDLSAECTDSHPRKRAALGDGISAGSASLFRDSSASPPRRSKARPTSSPHIASNRDQDTHEIPRSSGTRKQLWTEQDAPMRSPLQDRSNIASVQAQRAIKATMPTRKPAQATQIMKPSVPAIPSNPKIQPSISRNPSSPASDDSCDIILQPETRPISQEQLVAEVKGIYAGLVMVEVKCIEVDNKQAALAQADPQAQPKLNNEQWHALIALQRTLLHEHHDFFLASQHPSASPALRRLASKYAMPARMWRHGIHSFLELLRHRLPASLDHMLAFIYLAYSMIALLNETVPTFEGTWIECLGDLGRYRMAIEDDDIRDREIWTGVARHWYSRAFDKAPTTGRLYHHLAILVRPNALQQLYYYSKSLYVAVPFVSARESILTLFNPVLDADHGQLRLPLLDMAFVKAHGLLFTNKNNMGEFESTEKEFLGLLDNQIGRVTRKFMEQGYHLAISNSIAILGFIGCAGSLIKEASIPEVETGLPRQKAESCRSLAKRAFDYLAEILRFRQKTENSPSTPISSLKELWRRMERRFRRHRKSLARMYFLSQIQCSTAMPTGIPSPEVATSLWNTIVLAIVLGSILMGITYFPKWRETSKLLIPAILVNIASYILATDSRFSNTDLAIMWTFTAGVNISLLKDKLRRYLRTGGLMALLIAILGALTAVAFESGLSFPDGERYSNPLTFVAMSMLPATLFYEIV